MGKIFTHCIQFQKKTLRLIVVNDEEEGGRAEVLALEVEPGSEGDGLQYARMGLMGLVGPKIATI